jgi:hypothetical protein
MAKLSRTMSLADFDNGYWYATDLKAFADKLAIAGAARLRKDQLEAAIKRVLAGGAPPGVAAPRASGTKDVERGLHLDLPVVRYTNDRETKAFLEREAEKLAPGSKRKSGARYRLNRWRDAQLASGVAITYRDLVAEYARLNQTAEPFAKIPHGRYINFVAAFLATEPNATHARARAAWKKLKKLDVPKDYVSWVAARSAPSSPARRHSRRQR